ncbi:MAG: hypothetical protein H7Y01_06195, partial [Ferruginibacter sp.]|nr:hypothetical protein [Chitinophagaceae bacterium]
MIVYTSSITPRHRYIFDFVGKELTGEPFRLTESEEEFITFPGPGINYSAKKIKAIEFWVAPHSLLFENGIKQQTTVCFEVNNQKAFFKTGGDFPFDIFAAAFYLL